MRLIHLAAIAIGSVALCSFNSAGVPVPERPMILTVKQFTCLRNQADRLKIGKRGAVVDFALCPPGIEDPFYPSTPSQTKRRFMPADMDCLVRARRSNSRIAFVRPGGRVVVYLNPCGLR